MTSTTAPKNAYLGIDIGTQGLSVLLMDDDWQVVATGEASYGFVSSVEEQNQGIYEQLASDWEQALWDAIQVILPHLECYYKLQAIGLSGQMHGQVLVDHQNQVIGTVRLWCDGRNQTEADELSQLFFDTEQQLPKRCTICRWYHMIRHHPTTIAQQTKFITTPAGWLSYKLTNNKILGIGDASGMFPMDPVTLSYNQTYMEKFDALVKEKTQNTNHNIPSIASLLPQVACCGQLAGVVTVEASQWLGIPAGIVVAPAEGDQPAALAGSLIGRSGMVSCSFGTSVCANIVGSLSDPPVSSPLVNHFSNPNGQPIYMVWLRNGTTYFNSMVHLLTCTNNNNNNDNHDDDKDGNYNAFKRLMPLVLDAPADCCGLIALPFLDDEPGLHVHQGGTACLVGFTPHNVTPGNVAKAALLSTMFNIHLGLDDLQSQGIACLGRQNVILTGGLVKTPALGQILADVLDCPVTLLQAADEGCSWGAAVLAKYCHYYNHHCEANNNTTKTPDDWPTFLESIPPKTHERYQPNAETVPIYQAMYQRYKKLMDLQPQLQSVSATPT